MTQNRASWGQMAFCSNIPLWPELQQVLWGIGCPISPSSRNTHTFEGATASATAGQQSRFDTRFTWHGEGDPKLVMVLLSASVSVCVRVREAPNG